MTPHAPSPERRPNGRWGPAPLLALPVLALLACGGGAEVPAESAPIEVESSAGSVALPPEAYLARGTFGRVDVDLTRIRQSPYYPQVRELLAGAPLEQAEQRAALAELLERLDGITFALGELGQSGDLSGILLRGSLSSDEVRGWMAQLDASSREPQPVELDGHAGWAFDDTAAAVALDERTWILAPTEALRAGFAAPAVPAAFSDPAFLEAQGRLSVAEHALVGVVLGAPPAREMIARETPLSVDEVTHLRSLAFAVSVASGAQLEGHALLDDASVAQSLVARAVGQRDALASEAPIVMLGLADLVRSVELTQTETDATVRLSVTDATIQRLFGMVGGLMAMQGGGEP